jgi:hypothetical protein
MSYPPNHPEVARRTPQHGIVIAGSSSPFSSSAALSTPSKRALTVPCAKRSCGNLITVVPFTYYHGENVHVKVECGECYVPVVVEVEKRSSEEWVESEGASTDANRSVDGEEW